MPDPVQEINNNPNPPPTGADPKPPVNADLSQDFDPSKLTDEQLSKIYDDPRLYKHTRFAELTQAKKERDLLAAEKSEREKEQLKKNGEYEKLAKLAQEERDQARSEAKKLKIDTAIERAAIKAGAVDSEAVLALIDQSKVSIDEATGQVIGIDDAIKILQGSKEYLFGKGATVVVGNPTNPPNANAGQRFKHSQLQDPKFFRENEAAIRLAIREGRIDDDLKH